MPTIQNPDPVPSALLDKEARLKALLTGYGAVVIAYSGGVDSTYLSDVAHEVLGAHAHILLADSPSIPRSELSAGANLAHERGWNFHVVRTHEFDDEHYLRNDGKRCYYCKIELFRTMKEHAIRHNVAVMAYGANADDLLDPTRLGAVAAAERNVVAPLQIVGMTKADIRQLSERRRLPTADKPAFACLASRFPKGISVTLEDIGKVEKAEELLRSLGFRQYRARHHGDLCRIEVDLGDLPKFLDNSVRDTLVTEFHKIGYRFVTIDLAGYRSGGSA